jgi:hypothetical protein
MRSNSWRPTSRAACDTSTAEHLGEARQEVRRLVDAAERLGEVVVGVGQVLDVVVVRRLGQLVERQLREQRADVDVVVGQVEHVGVDVGGRRGEPLPELRRLHELRGQPLVGQRAPAQLVGVAGERLGVGRPAQQEVVGPVDPVLDRPVPGAPVPREGGGADPRRDPGHLAGQPADPARGPIT